MPKIYTLKTVTVKPSRIQVIRARVLKRLRKKKFYELTPKQIHWLIANDPIEQPLIKR